MSTEKVELTCESRFVIAGLQIFPWVSSPRPALFLTSISHLATASSCAHIYLFTCVTGLLRLCGLLT